MSATIRLGASLKKMLHKENDLIVDPGFSVRDTLTKHGIKPELIAMVVVNGEVQTKDYIIGEADIIRLMAVVGGG